MEKTKGEADLYRDTPVRYLGNREQTIEYCYSTFHSRFRLYNSHCFRITIRNVYHDHSTLRILFSLLSDQRYISHILHDNFAF